MNKLERNLIDNILESEVKLGRACSPITFYYPEGSLTELLDCSVGELSLMIAEFLRKEKDRLGNITIGELADEKGRKDDNIDPYVYHIEQNVFGLEYHRFTRESYKRMMGLPD